MEARRSLLDSEEKYAYVVKAEELEEVKTENGSLIQFIEEECFSPGDQGLRSFHKDFFGRNYRIEGLPFLGFSEEFAKHIADLDAIVEEKAALLLQEKIPTFVFPEELSVKDKLDALHLLKENDESHRAILTPLIGTARTAAELVIREKLINLYGLKAAENLIAAKSQAPSYLSNQIFCGAILPLGLLLRQATFSQMILFREDDEFYFKVINSDFLINDADCKEIGAIEGPVVSYFKLGKNNLGQLGYKFVEMRTNDKTIHDMYLGHMPSLEEVTQTYTYGAQEKQVEGVIENTSNLPGAKSAALITLAVIGSGIATGGVAWAVGVSALGIAATASVGAAAGGVVADKAVNRFGFFATPSAETTEAIDQPKSLGLSA